MTLAFGIYLNCNPKVHKYKVQSLIDNSCNNIRNECCILKMLNTNAISL